VVELRITDLATCSPADLATTLAGANELRLYVPLPSIGFAGEHLSIAEDFGEALYAGEILASFDSDSSVEMHYEPVGQRTSVIFSMRPTRTVELADAIREIAPLFDSRELEESDEEEILSALRTRVSELTDALPFRKVHFVELADSFMLNLVAWMSYDLVCDGSASDWEEHRPRQPECRFGYIRSSVSYQLEAECFSSTAVWALQDTVRLGDFLQRYGNDSSSARALLATNILYDATGPLVSNGRVAVRPSTQLFNDCTEMLRKTERAASFSPVKFELSADGSALFTYIPGWVIADLNANMRLLDQQQLEAALGSLEQGTETLRSCLGRPTDIACHWTAISDEAFESLCWDILHDCGQYEKQSLKKFGVSRSRDGGRDIEASRTSFNKGTQRFIFQCKRITNGRSLSGRTISITDVIDQYGANGFGVMTCTTVDATLHDKLEGISRNRGISIDTWDVLRIERLLGEHLYIRDRYFPPR
jgi:hypothetical protein